MSTRDTWTRREVLASALALAPGVVAAELPNRIENDHFDIEVDGVSGAISSFIVKKNRSERGRPGRDTPPPPPDG
jgi:hypothetical protein